MERVFLTLVAGGVKDEVIKAVRALMDFIHLASLHSHTTTTLDALRQALDDFHTYKDAFIKEGARHPEHFNIPKYHMLEHYVELIQRFGTADGFNTEWSERLHIDFAKDAYRASSKKDYTIQMTRWLSCQEAVERFTSFISWRRNGAHPPSSGPLARPKSAAESDTITQQAADTDPGTMARAPQQRSLTSVPTFVPPSYKIAKTHPRSLRAIPAERLILESKASRFLPALRMFLVSQGSLIMPYMYDQFDLFKQLTVTLPIIPEVSRKLEKRKNIIRATPPVPANGRSAERPPFLDFALVRTGEGNNKTDGTPLAGTPCHGCPQSTMADTSRLGLRVAQIKVIFSLPARDYHLDSTRPLAYIEWFTPFRVYDAVAEMFVVSRSTRSHQAYGEIIEVDRIMRNCHLVPKWSETWDSQAAAVVPTDVERCRSFYFNPYIDYHMFCMFKLHHYGCI